MTKAVEIQINRKSKRYSIEIAEGNLNNLSMFLKSKLGLASPLPKIFLVTHHNLNGLYGSQIVEELTKEGFDVSTELMNVGESAKSWGSIEKVLLKMIDKKLSRNSIVLALGGGVIGDLAGFAAAIYQRGIRLVQVPTSLLAMVDSSVGGKTAVNLGLAGKNLVGAFYQPSLVVADIATLNTLPEPEWRHGMSEVVKYALLRDDNGHFYKWLLNNQESIKEKSDMKVVEHMVSECVQTKANIVAKDELETGQYRVLLNLGHTFGHSLEAASRYRIAHGEAVAVGISLAARLAVKLKKLDEEKCEQILELLKTFNLPFHIDKKYAFTPNELIRHFQYDKKNEGSTVRFIVPSRSLSRCEIVKDIPQETLVEVFSEAIF